MPDHVFVLHAGSSSIKKMQNYISLPFLPYYEHFIFTLVPTFVTMYLFYSTDVDENSARFDETETRHCLQVLRKRPGDSITFTDGKGSWCEGRIEETGKKSFSASILSRTFHPKPDYRVHLAICPTKNIERFEWMLEKSTEIGIDRITPVICDNSERRSVRNDRLEKVLLAAMKQSLGTWLPVLEPLSDFHTFLHEPETQQYENRFIAHCRTPELPHLKNTYVCGQSALILIGPEGDFSENEILSSIKMGFREISLGSARLRTETAGIVATHIIRLLNE